MKSSLDISFLILLLPLAGAFINGVLGWKLPRRAVEWIACTAIGASFAFATWTFIVLQSAGPGVATAYDWLSFSWFHAPAQLYVDDLSATMALMVTGVSFIIHLYSVGYMREDEGYARYYMLLNLFVFSMLLLTLAGNLPLMFVGWEGVGFCSYALIGFWYKDTKNADAGRKAFIVTRIGDVGFGVALVWLFYFAGTTAIPGINAVAAASMPKVTATYIGLLLLAGAIGKSAQLPLTVWLPDAMAGPTPVSALIHAATMVTAGVYLLMRMMPVISASPDAMTVIATVGCFTAFYAATAALAQHDIKRVLAYSTISQVGYMILGVGAGSVAAPLFHLFIHAFFKALLFMAAGCVIQAMDEERDIFKMGGLAWRMPVVFWCFVAGALALAAAPGTGGFFSKDEILSAAFSQGSGWFVFLWALAEFTAFLTTIYIFRVVYLVFFGEAKKEPGRLPAIMPLTLVPLAVLSLVGGVMNIPKSLRGSARLETLLSSQGLAGVSREAAQGFGLVATAVLVFAFGIGTAYLLYVLKPNWRREMAARYSGVLTFLEQAWYLDRFYYAVIVNPFVRAANFLWRKVDEGVIDGVLDGAGNTLAGVANGLRGTVTGKATSYIMASAVGAAALLLYFAWSSS